MAVAGELLRHPLGIVLSSLTSRREVIATCSLDTASMSWLRDHTFGRSLSRQDRSLNGLAVVPFSVSLELMSQVASLLSPGRRLVGMKDVRAYRWIHVGEDRGRELLLTARKREAAGREDDIEVKIADRELCGSPAGGQHLFMEGLVTYGDEYRLPAGREFARDAGRPYSLQPSDFYAKVMFPGPLFRGVESIERVGESSIEATLRVSGDVPTPGDDDAAGRCTNPLLLDGAGQVPWFWIYEHLACEFSPAPSGFKELVIFDASYHRSTEARCSAGITSRSKRRIRSNIDLVDGRGRPLAHIEEWEDTAVTDWKWEFYRFMMEPHATVLSAEWTAAQACLQDVTGSCCHRFQDRLSGILPQWLAHIVLSRRERQIWYRMQGPEKRRREWLIGRVAAKDAVRVFLSDSCGIELLPADIEISTDASGRISVEGDAASQASGGLSLSLTHWGTGSAAVAAGGSCGAGIEAKLFGRDLRTPEERPLAGSERACLSEVPDEGRAEWRLRLWCAKEAAAKALDPGIGADPQNVMVRKLDVESGAVDLQLAREGAPASRAPAWRTLSASTGRDGNVVFAISTVARDPTSGGGARR